MVTRTQYDELAVPYDEQSVTNAASAWFDRPDYFRTEQVEDSFTVGGRPLLRTAPRLLYFRAISERVPSGG
ncbi:hypothetical protein LWP59_21470 [Amycolatopsis acidiphila]|uniref:Uncharacterized protein n=1 Tax=Amycolatopsis acidiphila TaxID=715473 RepID=A0A557ZUQ2_9PSEU|nr:hypothetical protein [Amycolatopsis acidiphila]TVT15678.1 hypothetical protein FNH06_35865 [Amycolatopsis acidiphila]UIJ56747.1 hypothetical protein LWP59_21470 [Amycolatopsis acidiphila]GHG55365.1 hypothetical protein GCM10017788_05880 [Amycolatopsis acidiphila]